MGPIMLIYTVVNFSNSEWEVEILNNFTVLVY